MPEISNFNWLGFPGTGNLVVLAGLLFVSVLGFRNTDRMWGADGGKRNAKLLVLLLSVVNYAICGVIGIVITIAWAIYRSLSFKGGAAAPQNKAETDKALVRHIWPTLFMGAIAAYISKGGLGVITFTCLIFLLYMASAYSLAVDYGKIVKKAIANNEPVNPKYNMKLELKRGSIFGLCFVFWAVVVYGYMLHLSPAV